MKSGIVIGLPIGFLIGVLVVGGYVVWDEYDRARKTAAITRATQVHFSKKIDTSTLDRIRTDPAAGLFAGWSEDYPEFLAFLDYGASVPESTIDDYRQIFNMVSAYFSNNTRAQIVEAVFRIHESQQYYYAMQYRHCLTMLQDELPPGFDPKDPKRSRSRKSARSVADEIHNTLVSAYMQPYIEQAEREREYKKQLQQTINENIKNLRARGQAENAARAAALAEHNRRVQRNTNYYYQRFRANQFNSTWRSRRRR